MSANLAIQCRSCYILNSSHISLCLCIKRCPLIASHFIRFMWHASLHTSVRCTILMFRPKDTSAKAFNQIKNGSYILYTHNYTQLATILWTRNSFLTVPILLGSSSFKSASVSSIKPPAGRQNHHHQNLDLEKSLFTHNKITQSIGEYPLLFTDTLHVQYAYNIRTWQHSKMIYNYFNSYYS